MGSLAFDTHKAVKDLLESGFDEKQAEALTGVLTAVVAGSLATKSDLKSSEASLKSQVETSEARLKSYFSAEMGNFNTEIEKIKARLALHDWMLGFILAGVAALVLKTFF